MLTIIILKTREDQRGVIEVNNQIGIHRGQHRLHVIVAVVQGDMKVRCTVLCQIRTVLRAANVDTHIAFADQNSHRRIATEGMGLVLGGETGTRRQLAKTDVTQQ